MTEYFSKMYPDGKLDEMNLKSGSSLTWSCLGPNSRPSGSSNVIGRGRINCIWINPNNFKEILIGASSGGFWKTLDSGINWECLTNSYMLGGVFDIAVDSNNNSVIYIATGVRLAPRGSLGLSGNYTLGLFKSTDSGITWTKCNITTTNGEYFNRVLIDPNNSSIVFALSTKKIYKSTNAGASWSVTSLQIPDGDVLTDMLFKPNNSSTLYASGYGNFIYKTTDGGTSWSKCTLKEPFAKSRITIATNPNDSEDLYAFYSDISKNETDPANKIEKTEDGGNTWTVKFSGSLTGNHYIQIIKVSSDGDVYAGGITIKKSNNDCSSFSSTLTSGLIHDDIMDIEFPDANNSERIYAATDGGVYFDDAGGNSWDRINGNLATNEFYSIGIVPGNSNLMVGGTHDCGSYIKNNDGSWTFKLGGDGGTSLYSHSGNGVYYLTNNKSFRRYNGTFTTIANFQSYNSPVCMNPINSDNIILQVYDTTSSPPALLKKSLDKGTSWQILDREWGNARDIVMCESNTNCIYYSMWDAWDGHYSRIRKSLDGGLTWNDVNYSGISDIIYIAPINSIFVHPFDENKIWALFGGFEQNKKIILFK